MDGGILVLRGIAAGCDWMCTVFRHGVSGIFTGRTQSRTQVIKPSLKKNNNINFLSNGDVSPLWHK